MAEMTTFYCDRPTTIGPTTAVIRASVYPGGRVAVSVTLGFHNGAGVILFFNADFTIAALDEMMSSGKTVGITWESFRRIKQLSDLEANTEAAKLFAAQWVGTDAEWLKSDGLVQEYGRE